MIKKIILVMVLAVALGLLISGCAREDSIKDKKNQQSYDQPSKEKIQETQAADNLDKDLNSLDDLENDDELGDIDKDLDNFKLD